MALGELHGRNLASALMRSRVHNRTSDRGGKPIQLAAVVVGIAPRSVEDRGRSSLLLLSRLPRELVTVQTVVMQLLPAQPSVLPNQIDLCGEVVLLNAIVAAWPALLPR